MAPSAARLGILMLDSRFPRIRGDVGNPETWDFPVRYAVVPSATPEAVVAANPEPLFERFVEVGQKLVAEGCTAIATTCGFLAPQRARLAAALRVPVAASALEQAAQIEAGLPADQRIGILTISATHLSPAHLAAAGVPANTAIAGLDGSSFAKAILGNETTLDVEAARRDITAAALELCARHKDLGALLLECTNMPPYAADVARATGLPVHSIIGYLNWFHESLAPARFPVPDRNQPSSNP